MSLGFMGRRFALAERGGSLRARSPRLSHFRIVWAVLVGITIGMAPPARAEEPTASELATAGRLFREGVAAAQEGRWEDAREAFERSYEIAPRATTLLNLAGSYVKTGKLVEARESYGRFLAEEQTQPAPRKRAIAEVALAELEPRLAWIRLTIDGLEPEDEIVLDGTILEQRLLLNEIPINPGEHELVVRREGFAPLVATFSVVEGEHRLEPVAARRGVGWVAQSSANEGGGSDAGPRESAVGNGEAHLPGEAPPPAMPPIERPKDDGESDGLLDSPLIWIAAGIVVVGAGLGVYALASQGSGREPFSDGTLTPAVLVAE